MGGEGYKGGSRTAQGVNVLNRPRSRTFDRASKYTIAALLFALVALGLALAKRVADEAPTTGIREDATLTFISPDGSPIISVRVELAQTLREVRRGLMFRELTDEHQGMLFIFDGAQPRMFWMRNTPTSLDIIFVGSDRRIINIASQTQPYSDQTYRSSAPAQFVVEVRAGFAQRHGIGPDTRIEWKLLSGLDKIRLDLSAADQHGLIGTPAGKHLLHYELCLPSDNALLREARLADPSLEIYDRSPGRIGCSDRQVLAVGHTGLPDYERRLLDLARLTYVERIEQALFE